MPLALAPWASELDLLRDARTASHAPAFANSQVSELLVVGQTRTVFFSGQPPVVGGSQHRAVEWFMDALGGEIRPDAEAERAFAAARARRTRPATGVRRRSGPPRGGSL